MRETIFETERLSVHPWNLDTDLEAAFEIYGDPEVVCFVGMEPDASVKITRQRIEEYLATAEEEELWGAVIEKVSGQVIGTVLLVYLYDKKMEQYLDDVEIGWHFRKASWGKGYATEVGRALIDYGLTKLKLPVLYAVITPANIASMRVAEKLGMTNLGPTDRFYDEGDELFEIISSDT
jgi:[ribosomal protein S5]-alanine N-acetyltransferase